MIRTRFILKPRIQLKYLLVSLTAICFTGLAVYYAFWSSMVNSSGMEELSAGEWLALERAYNTGFIWVILILALAVGFLSTFYFHRIVGPIYVFENLLKSLSAGDLTVSVHSRKNDELKDMASELQNMITNMCKAITDDRQTIDEIKRLIDTGDFSKAKEKLTALTRWYKI